MAAKKRKAPDDTAELEPIIDCQSRPRTASDRNVRQLHHAAVSSDGYYRRLYESEPDFRQLAKHDAQFAAILESNGQLDFSDPAATMQLTKTLLQVDFGLRMELPDDRLCPPVPNRHSYILWLKDLMDTTSYAQAGGKLCGLDVGTGASCIYPLLGTAQRPWFFIATDIDAKSLSYAKRNVELNGLGDRIRLLERKAGDALVPLDEEGIESIDFVMMNPPFYASEDEMLSLAKKKARPPLSACTGAPVEMVCEGGEVAHVGRLLQESLVLRERVRWYTSMLGKLTSVDVLVEQLHANGIDNYAVTEFVQGNKTRRWAVGWSFGPMRPADHVARGMKASIWRKILPPPLTTELLELPVNMPVDPVITRIREIVGSLELISWTWEVEAAKGVGRARENVWSRAWRRKRFRERAGEKDPGDSAPAGATSGATSGEHCLLGFAITVVVGKSRTSVALHWREGHDPLIFESFGGFLQGKLKDLRKGD
ncbi:Methyltransferase-like protein 16 [Madurella mycetomatis]|uniref:Methyltransferase-like protein 16 n=1 Tax=Madurella mycetomatis TaxID=100816 RepID=A0A175W8V4_9PEZI|nr:Methyltransferase-like protein 16 [Madurella mycetomatis]KXX80033.1 Methyltransferase-like protein 16 [Madurella mycetomatis]